MTFFEQKLAENKIRLIAAHRARDWRAARRLSQAKERIKKKVFRPRCIECGVPLANNSEAKKFRQTHCRMHDPKHLCMQAGRWLNK